MPQETHPAARPTEGMSSPRTVPVPRDAKERQGPRQTLEVCKGGPGKVLGRARGVARGMFANVREPEKVGMQAAQAGRSHLESLKRGRGAGKTPRLLLSWAESRVVPTQGSHRATGEGASHERQSRTARRGNPWWAKQLTTTTTSPRLGRRHLFALRVLHGLLTPSGAPNTRFECRAAQARGKEGGKDVEKRRGGGGAV